MMVILEWDGDAESGPYVGVQIRLRLNISNVPEFVPFALRIITC